MTYKRHLPARGPPGWAWLGGITGVILTGFYLHSRGIRIQTYRRHARPRLTCSELERERRQARFALMPLLLAEQDALEVRRRARILAAEALLRPPPPPVYRTDSRAVRAARPL